MRRWLRPLLVVYSTVCPLQSEALWPLRAASDGHIFGEHVQRDRRGHRLLLRMIDYCFNELRIKEARLHCTSVNCCSLLKCLPFDPCRPWHMLETRPIPSEAYTSEQPISSLVKYRLHTCAQRVIEDTGCCPQGVTMLHQRVGAEDIMNHFEQRRFQDPHTQLIFLGSPHQVCLGCRWKGRCVVGRAW
jgi:hypothetical protein